MTWFITDDSQYDPGDYEVHGCSDCVYWHYEPQTGYSDGYCEHTLYKTLQFRGLLDDARAAEEIKEQLRGNSTSEVCGYWEGY